MTPPDALHVLPLPPFPRPLAEDLAARLSRRVAVPCRVVEGALDASPRVPGRDQLDARELLRLLEARVPSPSVALVGLTLVDVGVPIFTFVFGLAQNGGGAALVSLARLDPAFYGLPPDPERTARRALGVMLHELGHVAGLTHCAEAACLMRFAGTVEKADARGMEFCEACRARLPAWLRPRSTQPRGGIPP